MSGFFKASLSAIAIIGCAAVVMLGILTAYGGYTLAADQRGDMALGLGLFVGGAVVALGGGLSLHLLLRRPRREDVMEDEGW